MGLFGCSPRRRMRPVPVRPSFLPARRLAPPPCTGESVCRSRYGGVAPEPATLPPSASRPAQVDLVNMANPEICATQVRPPQVRIHQVGLAQEGFLEIGSLQVRIREVGAV